MDKSKVTISRIRGKVILFLFIFCAFEVFYSQKPLPPAFDGYHKAAPNEIKPGSPIMLDPSVTPIFNDTFKLLNDSEVQQMLQSMENIPELYLDSAGSIKAIVFRKAMQQELKYIKQMQDSSSMMPSAAIAEKNIPKNGQLAPSFNVKDIYGKSFSSEELKGKIIVLNFWFVECKPCISEIPDLNELFFRFENNGVVFIAMGLNSKEQMKSFLKNKPFEYHIIANAAAQATSFGVDGFPTSFVINQKGFIHYASVGLGPKNLEKLEAAILECLQ
jgi:peroxiredoxin